MYLHKFRNNKRNIYINGQQYFSFGEYVELPEIINNNDIEYIQEILIDININDEDTNVIKNDDTIQNNNVIDISAQTQDIVSDDLSKKTVKELRVIADKLDIQDMYKLNKADLIKAIQDKH